MKTLLTIALAIWLMAQTSGAALAGTYDLAILNGRVIDPETMLDATLNVGVRDGRIAKITGIERSR